jgi:exodeoxyribonuclease VII small subunit
MATGGGGKRAERPAEPGAGGAGTGEAGMSEAGTGEPGARKSEGAPIPYEKARDELTDLVKRLEAGGLTLEQSLELWERGERLAAICEDWLEGARARLAAAMAKRADTSATPGTPF